MGVLWWPETQGFPNVWGTFLIATEVYSLAVSEGGGKAACEDMFSKESLLPCRFLCSKMSVASRLRLT